MQRKYSYKLRPGYGSKELLIEFGSFESADLLLREVCVLLNDSGFQLDSIEDLWVNDEILMHYKTENGSVCISKDIWDLVFILGERNQKDILKIDQILFDSGLFEKEEVDFSRYKLRGDQV